MKILKRGARSFNSPGSLFGLSLAGALLCALPGASAQMQDNTQDMPAKSQAAPVEQPVAPSPMEHKVPSVDKALSIEEPAISAPVLVPAPVVVPDPVLVPDNVPPPGYKVPAVVPDNVPPPGYTPVLDKPAAKPANDGENQDITKPEVVKNQHGVRDEVQIVRRRNNENLLGNYLAGRVARGLRDHDAAAKYFGKALKSDPASDILLEQTFVLELARGNWEKSTQLAKEVIKKGEKLRFSRMVLGLQAIVDKDFSEAENQFSRSEQRSPLGKMIGIIVESWLHQAKGESQKALDSIKRLDSMNWSKFYQDYHRAMIADQAGRHSLARKTYQRMFVKDPRSLRLMESYVRHLSSTGAPKAALRLMATHIERNGGHPLVVDLQVRVQGGEKLDLIASTPTQGLAELYYGIGDALTGDGGVDLGMIYLQAGLRLRPDLPLASMALAEAYEETKHFEQANRIYDKIGKDSPLWPGATVRRAFNLNSLKKVDEAKTSLDELIAIYPNDITAAEAQGNILRAHKRYKEAAVYYTKAISLLQKPAKFQWKYYYSRGVCFERLKDWASAEKDLLKARELDPDQALVLNYLGYSWVDQGLHLNKAMGFIRRAVELKPDDGYFVDSLGWAHFRLGNYKKASDELERAVELKPDDPVINDHLGDAYWRVGRKLEAQFQWAQALTLEPEDKDVIKIKAKIKDGMEKIKPAKALALGPGSLGKLKKAVAVKQSGKNTGPGKSVDDNRVHVVRSGESLWTISKRYYGKGQFHGKLQRANQRRLRKGNKIKPGLRLIIPPLRSR